MNDQMRRVRAHLEAERLSEGWVDGLVSMWNMEDEKANGTKGGLCWR